MRNITSDIRSILDRAVRHAERVNRKSAGVRRRQAGFAELARAARQLDVRATSLESTTMNSPWQAFLRFEADAFDPFDAMACPTVPFVDDVGHEADVVDLMENAQAPALYR